MRYSFDLYEPDSDHSQSLTPKTEVQWVPLQTHPIFTATADDYGGTVSTPARNLLASDGASRLYFWDNANLCLHRISIRLGEPDPTSVLAASPSKVLQPDVEIKFVVHKISINRNGSAMILVGQDGLCIMYLYGHTSNRDNTIVCRTIRIGSQINYGGSSIIRTLQVSWHPYSATHLGVLSSDSVFRLFNLSSDHEQPEQEYYLQPVEPGQSKNATSICPVDFSFGGDHLWDKFSVFILYSDGSIYILCPVVPFGSSYKWETILEIYNDAHSFGLKSVHSTAVSNSSLAINWLEATFPSLVHQAKDGGDTLALVAHPGALFDASLSLQGPLRRVCNNGDGELSIKGAECEGRAVSLLYNLISKDSVLLTAWSGGQLQVDALADEIQPVWNLGSPPRVRVDPDNNILGLAMICESITKKLSKVKLDQPLDYTVWLGHSPPLLRLAIVDLALPRKTERDSLITMFADTLMPERIYSLHNGGIDSIILHFLPFTSQSRGQDQTMRTPSVHPVLNTCQGDTSTPLPLCGFVSLSDSFGYSWIVGVTLSQECIILEMKTWNLLVPIQVNNFVNGGESFAAGGKKEGERSEIISKDLLAGPKVVLLPQTSPNMRAVTADSIEGRSMLHQYFKLFHENYVEYAHKVYFELKHHGPHLKRLIDDQHARLGDAQKKLLEVEKRQPMLEGRIQRGIKLHNVLEERLHRLRNLPGAHKKPLSKAEKEFKSTLDHFTGVELDALHTSIDTLAARLRRFTQSSKSNNLANQQQKMYRKNTYVQDSHIAQLKRSLEKLTLLNAENTEKVKLVESTISSTERNKG